MKSPVIKNPDHTLIRQGAEARIYRTTFNNRAVIAKERFSKSYRIKELDIKLRKRQVTAEIKALEKMQRHKLSAPELVFADKENCVLYMSEIEGQTVKEYIDSLGDLTCPSVKVKIENIATLMSSSISKMHLTNLIHSDLTTSNMLVPHRPSDAPVEWMPATQSLIDFGLSFSSELVEDRAVDLFVMERAVETTHANSEYLLHRIYNYYKNENVLGNKVQTRLNQVRNRGRKKSMLG